MLNKVSARREG